VLAAELPRLGQFNSPRDSSPCSGAAPHVLGQPRRGIARQLICVAPAYVRVLRVGFGVRGDGGLSSELVL
jgi:hypothetical protein